MAKRRKTKAGAEGEEKDEVYEVERILAHRGTGVGYTHSPGHHSTRLISNSVACRIRYSTRYGDMYLHFVDPTRTSNGIRFDGKATASRVIPGNQRRTQRESSYCRTCPCASTEELDLQGRRGGYRGILEGA
jgi:hypothetical protein